MSMDSFKKAYLIGIKGVGMTAAAQILRAHGVSVSGSDTSDFFFTQEVLKTHEIPFFDGFQAENVPKDADVIIYSTAYTSRNNPELAEAEKHQKRLLSYPEFIGLLTRQKRAIAVCGTHGKTTTTALLAHTLKEAGLDPSAVVGGSVGNWSGCALSGTGEYFVFEADEYQNKFSQYSPWGAILTSVDWDHPDFFPSEAEYKEVFTRFVQKIPTRGILVFNGDDLKVVGVASQSRVAKVQYGFHASNTIRIENMEYVTGTDGSGIRQQFEAFAGTEHLGSFSIALFGRHNVMNAAAVIGMCRWLGVDIKNIRKGLRTFTGVVRRFEYIGVRNGAILMDDYGHHPEEIISTLAAAKRVFEGRNIIVVFQPHTYSRTQALLEEFAQSFGDASKVYLLNIYASARERTGEVSSQDLEAHINRYTFGKAEFCDSRDLLIDKMKRELTCNDVVFSIGAGDVWEITHQLAEVKS